MSSSASSSREPAGVGARRSSASAGRTGGCVLLAGAAVLLVVAVVAGGFAAYQAEVARQSEQGALQAQKLAANQADLARNRNKPHSRQAARPFARARCVGHRCARQGSNVKQAARNRRSLDRRATGRVGRGPPSRLGRGPDHLPLRGRPTEVGALCTDLDPSGRYIAASGCSSRARTTTWRSSTARPSRVARDCGRFRRRQPGSRAGVAYVHARR